MHQRLAHVYEQMGEYDRALDLLQRAERGAAIADTQRARILARMGHRGEAERLLAQLESTSERHSVDMAAAYLALQDVDRAFGVLFEMTDRAEPGPNFVAVDPLFEPLRSDSRWPALLRRLNTPRRAQHAS